MNGATASSTYTARFQTSIRNTGGASKLMVWVPPI
jgi:hypothetical protein